MISAAKRKLPAIAVTVSGVRWRQREDFERS